MNIAIVDDDPGELNRLSEMIKEYAALAKLPLTVSAFHSAEEILAAYHPYAYTAVFLDIYMTGKTGVEAAKEILSSDRHAIIIFLTSSEDHMPEAFSLHAYDYIRKPAARDRIFKVMDDVMLRHTELDTAPSLTFHCDRDTLGLAYHDIAYVRTDDHNYLEIADGNGRHYITRLTFAEVSGTLSEDPRFLLILRGILVNMEYILRIKDGICTLVGGEQLPLSVRKAGALEDTWQNFRLDSNRNDRKRRKQR